MNALPISIEALPQAFHRSPLEISPAPPPTRRQFLGQSGKLGFAAGLTLALCLAEIASFGQNIRLGDDPAELPVNMRAQAEPHLARCITDPQLLAATFQEGRYAGFGAVNCGYAISTNGGLTWSRGLVPLLSTNSGGVFQRASDPVAGFDRKGNIYLCTLAFDMSGTSIERSNKVLVSKSIDRGQSFAPPVTALFTTNRTAILDKNWMVVNDFADHPTSGRIFVTAGEDVRGSSTRLISSYSDDGGKTWSNPQRYAPQFAVFPIPVFLPDGSLAIAYTQYSGYYSGSFTFDLVLSTNGGSSFSAPVRITSLTMHRDTVARDASDLLSMAVDREVGVLHVAYQARFGAGTNNAPRILHRSSFDKGSTWRAPQPVNDTPMRRSVFTPAISVSPEGQHVTILFCDKRNDNGSGNLVDMYLAQSFDAGETWETNIRISEVPSNLSLAPQTSFGRMYGDYFGIVPALDFQTPGMAIWIDSRTGSLDPFVAPINRTRGTTFDVWRKLHFTADQLAEPLLSGKNADPDQDGMANIAEYAFGKNPKQPDTAPLEIANREGKVSVSFGFSATVEDVLIELESSRDLRTWTRLPPAQQQDSFERGAGAVPWHARKDYFVSDSERSEFYRLRITSSE